MKQKTRKKTLWTVIMWLAIAGTVVCVGIIGLHFYNNYKAQKAYEELQAQIAKEEAEEAAAEAEASKYTLEEIRATEFTGEIEVDVPAPKIPEGVLQETDLTVITGLSEEELAEVLKNPVDFDKLTEINPELYAWICIPNTNINYPIAQRAGEDQGFYLHHDMNQKPRYSGCIYTEYFNHTDFEDPVTVIYGHNMKNGSMFQNLHKFRNEEFFEANAFVYLYTADKVRVYEIFSVYPYDDRHILNSFDFSDEKVLEKYLKECQHPRSMEALTRDDVEVTVDTPIITLSTCIGGRPDERLLVQAVLVYEDEQA